jgi:hypothetical protein
MTDTVCQSIQSVLNDTKQSKQKQPVKTKTITEQTGKALSNHRLLINNGSWLNQQSVSLKFANNELQKDWDKWVVTSGTHGDFVRVELNEQNLVTDFFIYSFLFDHCFTRSEIRLQRSKK